MDRTKSEKLKVEKLVNYTTIKAMNSTIKKIIHCPDWQVSCERVETLHGYEVCSWYNAYNCNWVAWVVGVGGWTDSENRENAIVGILQRALN